MFYIHFFPTVNPTSIFLQPAFPYFCFSAAKHLWMKRSFFLRTVLLCFYAVSLSYGITKHENLGWQLPNHTDVASHPAEKVLLCAVVDRKVLRINCGIFFPLLTGLQCNSNPMLNSCLAMKCHLAGTVFTLKPLCSNASFGV